MINCTSTCIRINPKLKSDVDPEEHNEQFHLNYTVCKNFIFWSARGKGSASSVASEGDTFCSTRTCNNLFVVISYIKMTDNRKGTREGRNLTRSETLGSQKTFTRNTVMCTR